MTEWIDQLRELAPRMMAGIPYGAALGLELSRLEKNRAWVTMPYSEVLIGDPETGVIAGGAVTTLLDQACGQAALAALSEYVSLATLDLRIDYMRPPRPREALCAAAECYKLTRSIAFVRATAYEGAPDDPIATAQGTFILNSDAGRKPGANLKTDE